MLPPLAKLTRPLEFEAKVVEVLTEAKQVDAEVQVVMHREPYHLWESNNDGRGLPRSRPQRVGSPGSAPTIR